jgi:hypothetical protein
MGWLKLSITFRSKKNTGRRQETKYEQLPEKRGIYDLNYRKKPN